MTKRYLGNIITQNPTDPTGDAAPGVWSLAEARAYKGAVAWPTLPEAPTIGTATDAGTGSSVDVAFTASELYGGTVSQYTVTSSPSSITGAGGSSPVTVTGLTAGTAYTFTVAVETGAGTSPSSSSSNSVTPAIPNRGLFAGGSGSNVIDFNNFNSSTFSDFGDLGQSGIASAGCGSETRCVFTGFSSARTQMQYVNPTSTGNSTNFGSITRNIYSTGCSNSTRGLFAGGSNNTPDEVYQFIKYITIATTGSASTFGDLTQARQGIGSLANTTRAVFAGGSTLISGSGIVNTIDYVTISSTGNATDFGDTTLARSFVPAGAASSTRGLYGGGVNSGFGTINNIEYITIASTGNGTDFGDLNYDPENLAGCSNTTYALWGGGSDGGSVATTNIRAIASTGNASGWGNLTAARTELAAASNCHGGI